RGLGDLEGVDALAERVGADDVGVVALAGLDVVVDPPDPAVVEEPGRLRRQRAQRRAGAGFPLLRDPGHDRLEPVLQLGPGRPAAAVDDAEAVGPDLRRVPGAV